MSKIGSINSLTEFNRLIPTVLGMKPVQLKGHSTLLLNNGRILIVKKDYPLDDCIWFLEVRVWIQLCCSSVVHIIQQLHVFGIFILSNNLF